MDFASLERLLADAKPKVSISLRSLINFYFLVRSMLIFLHKTDDSSSRYADQLRESKIKIKNFNSSLV